MIVALKCLTPEAGKKTQVSVTKCKMVGIISRVLEWVLTDFLKLWSGVLKPIANSRYSPRIHEWY